MYNSDFRLNGCYGNRYQSLKTEPRIKREIGYILCKVGYTCVEMASRKIGTYQNKANNLCTIFSCLT